MQQHGHEEIILLHKMLASNYIYSHIYKWILPLIWLQVIWFLKEFYLCSKSEPVPIHFYGPKPSLFQFWNWPSLNINFTCQHNVPDPNSDPSHGFNGCSISLRSVKKQWMVQRHQLKMHILMPAVRRFLSLKGSSQWMITMITHWLYYRGYSVDIFICILSRKIILKIFCMRI